MEKCAIPSAIPAKKDFHTHTENWAAHYGTEKNIGLVKVCVLKNI